VTAALANLPTAPAASAAKGAPVGFAAATAYSGFKMPAAGVPANYQPHAPGMLNMQPPPPGFMTQAAAKFKAAAAPGSLPPSAKPALGEVGTAVADTKQAIAAVFQACAQNFFETNSANICSHFVKSMLKHIQPCFLRFSLVISSLNGSC
jgi:hypothetical protein